MHADSVNLVNILYNHFLHGYEFGNEYIYLCGSLDSNIKVLFFSPDMLCCQ